MFILLIPAAIVSAVGLGLVRAVEGIEHVFHRHPTTSA